MTAPYQQKTGRTLITSSNDAHCNTVAAPGATRRRSEFLGKFVTR
jgi:hypothetical protein